MFDLGSALMNAEMAVEMLDNNKKANVKIIDVALVEGAILAAVNSSMNKSLDEIIKELEVLKLNKF
ncbi:PTS system mannnose-specific transporter subunit IIA [Mycoplasma putrefaciens]|nr:PTS system mannnose-specific transporter subunit IIA [Mycoplasma putrefaciens]